MGAGGRKLNTRKFATVFFKKVVDKLDIFLGYCDLHSYSIHPDAVAGIAGGAKAGAVNDEAHIPVKATAGIFEGHGFAVYNGGQGIGFFLGKDLVDINIPLREGKDQLPGLLRAYRYASTARQA